MNTENINKPEVSLDGITYRLCEPMKIVSTYPPLSTGPFYARPGVDPADWAYQPDARFLAGQTEQPNAMHCIQQRSAPETPHPSTVIASIQ